MITDKNKTIFDGVKATHIEKGYIPEFKEDIKHFSINKDKSTTNIVNDHNIPKFKFVVDDELNNFFNYPDISLSSNPEYRYKYPKLTKEEYIKQQQQTEEGTPNELNRFLRQEETGLSIEDIKQEDLAYKEGLVEIQRIINEGSEKIKKDFDSEKINADERDIKLEEKQNLKTKVTHILKRNNPVKINPVIKGERLNERLNREIQLLDEIQNSKNILKPSKQKLLQKEIINGTPLKSISKAKKPPFSTVPPRSPLPTPELPEDEFTNS